MENTEIKKEEVIEKSSKVDDTDAQLAEAKRIGKGVLVQGLTTAALSWIIYQGGQVISSFVEVVKSYKNQKKESE